MSISSLARIALSLFVAAAVVPAVAKGQAPDQAVCKDGTTTKQTGAAACDAHGGVDKIKTAVLRRTGVSTGEPKQGASESPAPVSAPASEVQRAGDHSAPRLPASVSDDSPARARSNGKSRAPSAYGDRDRRRPRNAVARCRDGTYDYGKGKKLKNVCKHHRGVGRWYGR